MLFLALLLLPLALVAQSEAELIELNAETLEFNAWQELYRQLLSPGSELGLDNRLWLTDQSYSLHRLMFRHQGRELALNLYNDWTDGDTDANVSIRLAQDKLLRDVALGHYRLQFGTGISMGSGKTEPQPGIFEKGKSGVPGHLHGVGIAAKHFPGSGISHLILIRIDGKTEGLFKALMPVIPGQIMVGGVISQAAFQIQGMSFEPQRAINASSRGNPLKASFEVPVIALAICDNAQPEKLGLIA